MNERITLWNLHSELKFALEAAKRGKRIPRTKQKLWRTLLGEKFPAASCEKDCASWLLHSGRMTSRDRKLFAKLQEVFGKIFRNQLAKLEIKEQQGYTLLVLRNIRGSFSTSVDEMRAFLQCYLVMEPHVMLRPERKPRKPSRESR